MGEIRPGAPLSQDEESALRRAAVRERQEGSAELASLMERFAAHGLPRAEDCVPWEAVRDERYRQLGILTDGPRVA